MKKIILLIVALVCNCGYSNSVESPKDNLYPFNGADKQWVQSVFNSMTLNEKIGQLFMVAAYSDPKQNNAEKVKTLISQYKIGGVIFMKGSPVLQVRMTNEFQSMSKVPLSIGIDGEWGLAMRLDSTISYPKQMQLGAITNDSLLYQMGVHIGQQCARMGIHINFAPDVDINNNPNNPVINFRSFGESKTNVAEKSYQYMRGMQSQQILTTAKHFPGHGDTDADSHKTMPLISASKNRIDTLELYPYKYLINKNLTGVMVAHLSVPALEKNTALPSTLSPKIITDLLRNDLRFNGLIFTDALNMKGVSAYYPDGEIEVRALLAGNDVLLFTEDVPVAINAIKKAIAEGRLNEKIINDRCYRILLAKSWMKVPERNHVNEENLYNDLHKKEFLQLNKKLIQASITVVKDDKRVLPFRNLDKTNIAIVSFGNSKTFRKWCAKYTNEAFVISSNGEESAAELDRIKKELQKYSTVILEVQGTSMYAKKNYGISQSVVNMVSQIAKDNNVVLVLHANPYGLNLFTSAMKDIESVVVGYDFTSEVQRETPQVLFGALPAQGRLSVGAGGFKVGTGVMYNAIGRLRYGDAIDVGMDCSKLRDIDSIVNLFMQYGAMPGCEVLVAKDGIVVYEKPFGVYSYGSKDSVTENTIYDLASVTKAAATSVSLMKLYDEGLFSLDKTMGDYLPYLEGTWKDTLKLCNVLTHQSRLRAGVSFVPSLVKNASAKGMLSRARSAQYPYRVDNSCFINSSYSFYDKAISSVQDSEHSIPVAKNVWLNNSYRDSITRLLVESPPCPKPGVVYSDLGFYMMADVIKNISGLSIEDFANQNFYAKLGASTLGYHPLNRFPEEQIAPTEEDEFFRKQLLRGYVHDQGAAMMGGVSGHAGLFSNANDLAKLSQMLLNKGYYGGEQYIKPETVELFTSCPFCANGNRKGYGFDKPEPDRVKVDPTCHCTSLESYGHVGFTGTLFWIDPEKSIIYVFLSNRVNRATPDASNTMLSDSSVRARIQRAIYNAII